LVVGVALDIFHAFVVVEFGSEVTLVLMDVPVPDTVSNI
jgi:hypothetical protein